MRCRSTGNPRNLTTGYPRWCRVFFATATISMMVSITRSRFLRRQHHHTLGTVGPSLRRPFFKRLQNCRNSDRKRSLWWENRRRRGCPPSSKSFWLRTNKIVPDASFSRTWSRVCLSSPKTIRTKLFSKSLRSARTRYGEWIISNKNCWISSILIRIPFRTRAQTWSLLALYSYSISSSHDFEYALALNTACRAKITCHSPSHFVCNSMRPIQCCKWLNEWQLIREDLTTARTSRSPLGGDSTGGIRRQRVFVGLGSALQGLCLYLCKEEALRLRLRHSRDTTRMSPSMPLSLTPAILAVVCVDPPLHLWKACGSYILEQMSLEGIPSFFVGYTEKDGEGVEHIHTGLAELLNGCKHHPRALALVAKDSATFLRRPSGSNATEKNRDFDACVWLARLIAKYAESVQRIRSPPRWQLGTMPRKDEGPGRSML